MSGAGGKEKRRLKPLEAMASGSVAGVVSRARTVCVPNAVDAVLERNPEMQERSIPSAFLNVGAGYYRGWMHALRVIVRDEGARALFKGNLTADMLYFGYGAIQFGIYNEWKSRIGPMTPTYALMGGGMAGATATIITYPLDILRTRMAAQGEPRVYPTLRKAIVSMYRAEGAAGFFKGLSPTLVQILPYMSLQFYLYEASSSIFKRISAARQGIASANAQTVSLASSEVLVSGAVAGAISKLIVLPFDTVRKRLQVQGFEQARVAFGRVETYDGFIHCVRTILKKEGVTGFYKGGVPATLKALLASAVTWAAYERAADVFDRLRPEKGK